MIHQAKHYAQLAKNLKDLKPKDVDAMFPGYISEKLDGVFMFAVCIGGGVEFYSRTGELVLSPLGTQIEKDIRAISVSSWVDFVLVGEFYKPDTEQSEISGVFRKQKVGYAEGYEYHIHDTLRPDEFSSGLSTMPYYQRLQRMDALLFGVELCSVRRVPQNLCFTSGVLIDAGISAFAKGAEGVIYRPQNAGYVAGNRGTNLVRIKQECSYDLEVLGVNEVKRSAKGGLEGSIKVKWRTWGNIDGEIVEQDIRGMSHEQLLAWADNPSLIVGKIVKVAAMRLTRYGMLREPRFKEVRFDKEAPDL